MIRSLNRFGRRLALAVSLVVMTACGSGGDPLSPPTTGGVAVTIGGLPNGVAADVMVTGPGGFTRAFTASGTADGLVPGSYTITATSVASGANAYAPATGAQTVQVPASPSRVQVTVAYAQQNSQMVLTLSGLPGGTNGNVLVTNASGYSQVVTATTTLSGLLPGLYTVAASSVTSGSDTYAPSPASQQVQVSTGQSTSAAVAYAVSVPGTVNLVIDGITMTQSVQSYDDTVPLVANRDAYLRVFVRADQVNAVTPAVRVRLYQGANPSPIATYTLPAPAATVPMAIDQGTLNSSWNQLIPASQVTTGLRILVDVDPGNGVPESNETDNTYPASGLQKALDVRAVAAFNIHFVPVTVQGLTGNVTLGNANQFVTTLKKVMPLEAVTPTVRGTPYSSSADTLKSDNANGAWGAVLSEMYALQQVEGTGKYFYGVVKPSYGGGVAGIGYVPGRAAVGWDKLPSGDGVLAHEVGHNLSLSHAPCGSAGNPDPNFPYAGGKIGVYGLDVGSLVLKAPSAADLMGYCNAPEWISDYHYQKALNYRQNNTGAIVAGAQSGLLVWGRIVNGFVALEPAFEVSAPASPPSGRGSFTLEGLDDGGTILFSYAFDGERVADQDGDQRQFAFVIPLNATRSDRLARLRVRGGSRIEERASSTAMAVRGKGIAALRQQQPSPDRQARRAGAGLVQLQWNAAAYPMALVRDAATGEILSFARRGNATIAVAGRDLDITYSDGVRSRQERVTPQ